MEVLWDTGAQVSIITDHLLKKQLSDLEIRHINELLEVGADLKLTAANGTSILYEGSVEARFRLHGPEEKEVTVPFLVTREQLEQPTIGYNVIELNTKDSDNLANNLAIVHSVSRSFTNVSEENARQLISLIQTNNHESL